MTMDTDDLIDGYIEATATVLGLTIEPLWKPAVRFNLVTTLKMVTLVDSFDLPDDAEPAPVFRA